MTTREEAEKALATVEALKERALEIMAAPTIMRRCYRGEEFMRVEIVGDQARATWPDVEDNGYGAECNCGLTEDLVLFPAAPLFMSEPEFAAWMAKQKEIVAARERAEAEAAKVEAAKRKAAAAKAERATYERLKAKYEGKA